MKKPVNNEELSEHDWIVEICSSIAYALQSLRTLQRVTIRRDDLGVTITSYFNHRSVVKIDLQRQDKRDFFSVPLPVDQSLRNKVILKERNP